MKNRKFKIFLILLGLTQYYFIFGKLDANTWFNSVVWLCGLYFGANTVEGAVGKEKPAESKSEGK